MRFSGIATWATAFTLTTGLALSPPAAAIISPGGDPSSATIRLRADPGSPVRSTQVPVTDGARRTSSYSMLGVTWRGSAPTLRLRTHNAGGWSPWQVPEVLDDGPDGAERTTLRATELLWVGLSDGVQVDAGGAGYRNLQLVLIDPGVLPSDQIAPLTPTAHRGATRGIAPVSKRAPRPPLFSRQQWGADPSWRNGSPVYNGGLRQVHLHHTATENDYAPADVPAILRGMYRYHTQSLGWFDLGYNFVVDKFGRAWVGRSGGVSKLVRGAHTLGFNHNSVGIAVLGNFEQTRPTQKALTAVVRLAAWKLDRHRRTAMGRVTVTSEGSDRYAAGRDVRLPVIDAHRATNDTACPGAELHQLLPMIRHRTQKRIERY